MSLTRAFNKAVNKATYDPELEKQIAVEKKEAREVRTKLRQSLSQASKNNRDMLARNEITKQGSTLATSTIQEAQTYLKDNAEATSDELQDKTFEVLEKLATIYSDDKNRLLFVNNLKMIDALTTAFQNQNVIDDDTAKKIKAATAEENAWYEKNQNESLETYNDRLNELQEKLKKIVPSDLQQRIDKSRMEQGKKTQKEIDEMKAKAEAEKKAKEELEKQQFNLSRLTSKLSKGIGIAFLVALFFVFGLTGGSLLSNEAIARPVPYRILYFIFGFIFSIPVIVFYIGRAFMGHPPYYASYLLPLYSYDPLKEDHSSFFESLVWFKENAVVRDALEKFQEKANSVQGLRLVRG